MILRRRVMVPAGGAVDESCVDLGLPSGLLWAKGNLCKDSQGNYYIGEETDWGTYVSWGNIDGHNEDEGYDFNSTNYNNSQGASVSADIPPTDSAHDICYARLGVPWHLPTTDDFLELRSNTDYEWVADYNSTGVAGCKFMKKSDHSVYIFFPASGHHNNTSLINHGGVGRYFSASFFNTMFAWNLRFDSSNVYFQDIANRNYGMTIRPVK